MTKEDQSVTGQDVYSFSLALLAILGPGLKVGGVLEAPWWWILSPIWISIGVGVVTGALLGLARAVNQKSVGSQMTEHRCSCGFLWKYTGELPSSAVCPACGCLLPGGEQDADRRGE